MNIHEAALKILEGEELPDVESGLCGLMYKIGVKSSYDDIGLFMSDDGTMYLPDPGRWTDQRLNIICLLAITEPEDFH